MIDFEKVRLDPDNDPLIQGKRSVMQRLPDEYFEQCARMQQQRENHKTRWGDIQLLVEFPKIRDQIFGKTERLKDNL